MVIEQSQQYPLQFVAGLNPALIDNVFDYLSGQIVSNSKAGQVLASLVSYLRNQKKPVSGAPIDKALAGIVYEVYFFLLVRNSPNSWAYYRRESNPNGGYMAGAYWCPFTWSRDIRNRLASAYLRSQYFQMLAPEARIWSSLSDFHAHGGG
jgi:hypothetical protein